MDPDADGKFADAPRPDPEEGGKRPREMKENTRAILESVCSDFENIDLPCTKPKVKPPPPPKSHANFIQYGRVTDVNLPPADAIRMDSGAPPEEKVLTLNDANALMSNLFAAGGKDVSSSVAELADAEIVQTGDDCVSIIITNPRFVEVMTGPDGIRETAEIIDVPQGALEPDPQVVPPEPKRPMFDKPVIYRPDSNSNAKARRITPRMKNAWAKELETKGHLTCPLPGCLQTFETMTNFRTHYKFCAGTARFEKCLHCASLIIASKSAMFQHMQVEHPEKLPEDAVAPPASPERGEDCFLADFDGCIYTEEIMAESKKHKAKRKLSSSKENFMQAKRSGKGAIFKNKKRMKESLIKNIEDFRKCVKFDTIVDKIKGVEDVLHRVNKPLRMKRKRFFLTSNVVEKEKIFEDETDDPAPESNYASPMHTKSKLVLPFEPRYKRYSEHLRVSRDWTSERRTYSRSRPHDAETSMLSLNESVAAEENVATMTSAEASSMELSLDATLDTTIERELVGESDGALSFPPASNEVVCGTGEVSDRVERPVTIKVEKTPSRGSKFIFYGLTIEKEANNFAKLKAKALQSKEDGIKLPLLNQVPVKRPRGRPPKHQANVETAQTVARMNEIRNKIAAKKLKHAKRGRPRKNPFPPTFPRKTDFKNTSKSSRGGRRGPYRFPTSHMQALNNIVSNMYRAQKSQLLQRKAPEDFLPASIEAPANAASSVSSRVQPVVADCLPIKTVTTPVVVTASPVKESTLSMCVVQQDVAKTLTDTVSSSAQRESASDASEKVTSDALETVTPDIPQRVASDASPTVAADSLASEDPQTVASNAVETFNSNATETVITNADHAVVSETAHAVVSDTAHAVVSATAHAVVSATAHAVVSDTAHEVASNAAQKIASECVQTLDKMPMPQDSHERARTMTESKRDDADQSQSKEVTEQIMLTDSAATNSALVQQLPKENQIPVMATPTPEKKRGRGRPRKIPREDGDIQSPKPEVEKKPVTPATPDLPSPGIRKSQRARKSKFSADHSDYVSAITPQKASKLRSEIPRTDSPGQHMDGPATQSPGDAVKTKVGEESPGEVVVKRKRGRPRKNSQPAPIVSESPPVTPAISERRVVEASDTDDTPAVRKKHSRKNAPRKCVRESDRTQESKELEKEELLSEISAISNGAPLRREDPAPEAREEERVEDAAAPCRCSELTLPLKKRKHSKGLEKKCPHTFPAAPAAPVKAKSPPHKKKKEQEKKQPPSEIVSDDVVQDEKVEEPEEVPGRRTSKRLSLTKRKSYSSERDEEEEGESEDEDYIPEEEEVVVSLTPSSSHSRRRQVSAMKHWREISVPVLKGGDEKCFPDNEKTPFPEYLSLKSAFPPVVGDKENTYEGYLPPFAMSLNVLFAERWTRLEFFESLPVDGVQNHYTFFTGGPVLCSAFCPTPGDTPKDQYVALSINVSLSKNTYSCGDEARKRERGQLQFWNVGNLHDRTRLERKPMMEMALCHNHLVYDMAFCPAPACDDPHLFPPHATCLPRLGILATACSDSLVRIYAIPQPASLESVDEGPPPLYSAKPVVVLEPLCDERDRSVCVSLCWERKGPHTRLCAGYGSGLVCIYLLKRGTAPEEAGDERRCLKISPYTCFQAHGSPVTSISFAPLPDCRFLLTSSLDRAVKFWDLHGDVCSPVFSLYKKGMIRHAHWPTHWHGPFGCLEDGTSLTDNFVKEPGSSHKKRHDELPLRLLTNHGHSCMKSAVSEFLNAQVVVDMAGTVSVSVLYSPKMSHPENTLIYSSELKEMSDGANDDLVFDDAALVISELLDVVPLVEELSAAANRQNDAISADLSSVSESVAGLIDAVVSSSNESRGAYSGEEICHSGTDAASNTVEMEEVQDEVPEAPSGSSRDFSAPGAGGTNEEDHQIQSSDTMTPEVASSPGFNNSSAVPHSLEDGPILSGKKEAVQANDPATILEEQCDVTSTENSVSSTDVKVVVKQEPDMENSPSVVECSDVSTGKGEVLEACRYLLNSVSEELKMEVDPFISDSSEVKPGTCVSSTNLLQENGIKSNCLDTSSVTQENNIIIKEEISERSDRKVRFMHRKPRDSRFSNIYLSPKESPKFFRTLASCSPANGHSFLNAGCSGEVSYPRVTRISQFAFSKKLHVKYRKPRMLPQFPRVSYKKARRNLHSSGDNCTETLTSHFDAPQTMATSSSDEIETNVTMCLDELVTSATRCDEIKTTMATCLGEVESVETCLDEAVSVASCLDEARDITSSLDDTVNITSCLDEAGDIVTSLDASADITSCVDEVEDIVSSLNAGVDTTSCVDEVADTLSCLDDTLTVTSYVDEVGDIVSSLGDSADITSCVEEMEAAVTSLDEAASVTSCVEEMGRTVTLEAIRAAEICKGKEASISQVPILPDSEIHLEEVTNNLDEVEVMVTSCFDEDSVDSFTDEVRVSNVCSTLLRQTLEKNFHAYSQNKSRHFSDFDSEQCSCVAPVNESQSLETFEKNCARTCAFCQTLLQDILNSGNASERGSSESERLPENEQREIVGGTGPIDEDSNSEKAMTPSDSDSPRTVPHSESEEDISGLVCRLMDSLLRCMDRNDFSENSVITGETAESVEATTSSRISIGKRIKILEAQNSLLKKKKSKAVKKLGIKETASLEGESGKEETPGGPLGDVLEYEKIASTRGLVFRDNFNLWKSRIQQSESSVEVSNFNSFQFDPFNLASINTVCWNPNFGCRFWICTGSQSGIARLSCLSDMVPGDERS